MDGLYEVFAPGSTVGKISRTTSIKKETNRPEFCVRNSDIAKFGTQNERDTELGQYIERRPKKVHKKTLEQTIVNNRKDLLRKDLGSKKIKHIERQTFDVSVLSSRSSCISTSSNVVPALRMRIPKKSNPKHDDAFINRPDLTQIFHFSPPVPSAAPPTQPDTAGPSAVQMTPLTKQLTPILRKEKRTITVSDTSDSDTSSLKRSRRLLKIQKKSATSSSILEKIQRTVGCSAETPI